MLLQVYAPWCGHCKAFAPDYAALAARFCGVATVRVAKMDGTTNEVPEITVDGYPTIVLVTADNRVVDAGEATRSVEGLTEFVLDHASAPIDRTLLLPAAQRAAKEEL